MSGASLGAVMATPSHRRKVLERRALMHLSLLAYRVRFEVETPGVLGVDVRALAGDLQAIVDELNAIAPQLLVELQEAA